MTGTAHTEEERYAAVELQAAAMALLEGQFRSHSGAIWPTPGPVLLVLGVAGDGQSSAVALAIAEAADAAGHPVRLVDAAPPAWSMLAAAPTVELDVKEGWRRGRRGAVLIDRVAEEAKQLAAVPVPRSWTGAAAGLTVVDAGWTTRELAGAPGTWLAQAVSTCDAVLVVGHEAAAAVGVVESALGVVGRDEAMAVALTHTGRAAGKAPSAGGAGRRLRQMQEQDVVHLVPAAALAVGDLAEGRPLPRGLRMTGTRLLAALSEDLWPQEATTSEAI